MEIATSRNGSLSQYFGRIVPKAVIEYLVNKDDEYIANVKIEELVDYLISKFTLPELILDPDKEIETKHKKHKEEYWSNEHRTDEHNLAETTMHFTPSNNLHLSLSLSASSEPSNCMKLDFDEKSGSIVFISKLHYPEQLNWDIEYITQIIQSRNPEIIHSNQNLRSQIQHLIEDRKNKIKYDREIFEKAIQQVSIPLKRKEISETPLIDLRVRKVVQELREPIVHPRKEFVLDRKYVLDILEIIGRSGEQFELNPEVYGAKLEEEDLRSIILAHLNTIFEGSATGETFSKQGKTDIYLNISQGQIFIAECKLWSGEIGYGEAIDQLIGRYITWRRNYAAIITFVNRKNFTSITRKAKSAVKNHLTYADNLQELGVTHFQSTHKFPGDEEKELEVHHLLFNLHYDKIMDNQ
jgi:hypothetical protein